MRRPLMISLAIIGILLCSAFMGAQGQVPCLPAPGSTDISGCKNPSFPSVVLTSEKTEGEVGKPFLPSVKLSKNLDSDQSLWWMTGDGWLLVNSPVGITSQIPATGIVCVQVIDRASVEVLTKDRTTPSTSPNLKIVKEPAGKYPAKDSVARHILEDNRKRRHPPMDCGVFTAVKVK